MQHIILASESLASGAVTRQQLRTRYIKLHRNVYALRTVELTARDRAMAAWLWSGREAVLVGTSAAAMLGTRWISAAEPAEIGRARHTSAPGIIVRSGRIGDDELCLRGSVPCTTPARTAYDIGRCVSLDSAIVRIDALMNATGCSVAAVETLAARYPGARGCRRLHAAVGLADGGAESPQETRLRLVLVRRGLPRPTTQIPVTDARGNVVRRIDMGWPQWRVGVEYDGEHHWTNPRDHAGDIDRLEFLASRGWLIVRVSARHMRHPDAVAGRAVSALTSRGWTSTLH